MRGCTSIYGSGLGLGTPASPGAPAQLSAALAHVVTELPPPPDTCAWQVLATAFRAAWFCNQGLKCEPGTGGGGEEVPGVSVPAPEHVSL